MFKKILFYYDETGAFRGDIRKDHSLDEKPFTLLAEHCNAKYFYVNTTTHNGHQGSVPALAVKRALGPLGKDPYNEDGDPPALMFFILMPFIEIFSNTMYVEGIESPNMSWAGLLAPPYTRGYEPKKGVAYMSEELHEKVHWPSFVELKRQRILLVG